MMKKECVSVIVNVCNREKYINKCLDSILSQKNVDLEIIIVDDGSTDSSPEIIDNYAARYDNIKVIHQDRMGLPGARNTGIENATGEFIIFVDDDDFLPDNAIFNLLQIRQVNDADLVIGNYATFNDDGTYRDVFKIPDKYCNRILSNREVCELLLFCEKTHVVVVTWGKLYKRSLWNNVRFPIRMLRAQDQFVFHQILDKCEKIYFTDMIVYNQLLSSISNTRTKPDIKNLFHTEAVAHVTNYLIEKRYWDIALYKFGVGTRNLIENKAILKDKESKDEIIRLYNVYKQLAKKLFLHVGFIIKLRFLLFMMSLKLYTYFQKIYSKNIRK